MTKLKQIASEIREEEKALEIHSNDIDKLTDDEDKDYVLMRLGQIRESLLSLAAIIDCMY